MSGVKVEVKAIDWCYENAAVIYIDSDGERFEGYIKSLDDILFSLINSLEKAFILLLRIRFAGNL